MPYDVPAEHIEQAYEAKTWFEQYYTKYPDTD
jgi:hypothetical protein